MTYGQRVAAVLGVFFGLVLGANGYFVHLSRQWASDDLRVGHGHSKFPPQVLKDGAGKAQQEGHR